MATVTFYNVSATDEQRFSQLLKDYDLDYELVPGAFDNTHSKPDTQVISIFASDIVSREAMDGLPNLKLIATRTTGFDHIDLAAAKEKSITVVNVPRYGESTVAEYTFALLLALSRKLAPTFSQMGTGAIDVPSLQGFDLAGKTLGVVGTGRIGQHAIKIAKGFGMEVIAFDLRPKEDVAKNLGFQYVSLNEIAEKSDVITLHAPGTPETHHMVDSSFLGRVKSSSVLVNTARGELVDTTALVQALSHGKLAGAALDVLEHEELLRGTEAINAAAKPVTADQAQAVLDILSLKAMPQVILTPHNAFNTAEALDRIRQTTVQNIIDFYQGETPNKVEV